MNRSDLVNKIESEIPELDAVSARKGVDTILEAMTDTLADQGRIEVRGFGTFSIRERKARKARNPKTGEKVDVNDHLRPHFKPGKELRARVNY